MAAGMPTVLPATGLWSCSCVRVRNVSCVCGANNNGQKNMRGGDATIGKRENTNRRIRGRLRGTRTHGPEANEKEPGSGNTTVGSGAAGGLAAGSPKFLPAASLWSCLCVQVRGVSCVWGSRSLGFRCVVTAAFAPAADGNGQKMMGGGKVKVGEYGPAAGCPKHRPETSETEPGNGSTTVGSGTGLAAGMPKVLPVAGLWSFSCVRGLGFVCVGFGVRVCVGSCLCLPDCCHISQFGIPISMYKKKHDPGGWPRHTSWMIFVGGLLRERSCRGQIASV